MSEGFLENNIVTIQKALVPVHLSDMDRLFSPVVILTLFQDPVYFREDLPNISSRVNP